MSAPDQPTPWTDARVFQHNNIDASYCRALERHLRRIVDAWEEHDVHGQPEMAEVINQAKDFLK